MPTGKFFVFEGIDGSGKSTQVALLAEHLTEKGYDVEQMHFPQHESKSAGLVDEYLSGKYGAADQVGPYVASVFYASDRYDASFKIRTWLAEGKIIISDRYIVSNIGHQGGKISNKDEWNKYVNWLYDLEYNLFKIPKPDYTFIFNTLPGLSLEIVGKLTEHQRLQKKESYLNGKQDIHEKSVSHLENALRSYLWAAKEFPQEFKVIECIHNGVMLPIQTINNKIIKLVEEKI
jgi:dTMP kinase